MEVEKVAMADVVVATNVVDVGAEDVAIIGTNTSSMVPSHQHNNMEATYLPMAQFLLHLC